MERTQEGILARIEAIAKNDVRGLERNDLVDFLDYEHAKPYLKEGTTEEEWAEYRAAIKPPKEQMKDYMDFAWEKANNKRGISAYRSLCHYSAWLWLDDNEELAERIREYEYYGKPQLIAVCEYLCLDPEQWDDHIRESS